MRRELPRKSIPCIMIGGRKSVNVHYFHDYKMSSYRTLPPWLWNRMSVLPGGIREYP